MEDENQLYRDQEMIEIDRLIEYLDFENAKILLENKFKKEENNVQVIDSLSEVLLNLGDADSAIKLIKKSISIEPNKNGEKYMTIGQLSCGGKSTLKYYEKGVQVFISEIQNEKNEKKIIELKDSLASAYASIAELHMTTDLCNEENAEEICEKCLNEALIHSPDSFDAIIQLSNLRILRKRDEEANIYMEKIYQFIFDCLDKCNDQKLPTHDIILNLSKNYAELEQYTKAIKLLDVLIKLNDEDLECWYLLSFYHFTVKNFKHSAKCLKNFKRVCDKNSFKSDSLSEFQDAANELAITLENVRISSANGELINNNFDDEEENEEILGNTDQMNIDN